MTTTIIENENERKRIHETRGFKNCNVPNCPENAEYINPNSSFKYCQIHFDKLEGKIKLFVGNTKDSFVKLQRLVG